MILWWDMPGFSDKALISEIFSSLQGEGPLAGERHLFIRFAGCDVGCSYCDEHEKKGHEMSLESVLEKIEEIEKKEGPHSFVSLTGGEPLLQKDFLALFLPEIRHRSLRVLLETNGVRWCELREVIADCDIISMDIKLPSVGGHQDFLEEHQKFLTIASAKKVYIKIIVSADLNLFEFGQHIAMISRIAPEAPIFIQSAQPEEETMNIFLSELIQWTRTKLRDVRLGIQLHKMFNMP